MNIDEAYVAHAVAERTDLRSALTYLLKLAAWKDNVTPTVWVQTNQLGRWHKHMAGANIAMHSYNTYRRLLCSASHDIQSALDRHWQRELAGPNVRRRTATTRRSEARSIQLAQNMARESRGLRLARVSLSRTASAPAPDRYGRSPHDLTVWLTRLGQACNGQNPAAADAFISNQGSLLQAVKDVRRVGQHVSAQIDLLIALSALLRFAQHRLARTEMEAWYAQLSAANVELSQDRDLARRASLDPAHRSASPRRSLEFASARAGLFVGAVGLRQRQFGVTPVGIKAFQTLGAPTMAAYAFLLHTQAFLLNGKLASLTSEIKRGEHLLKRVRAEADSDTTRAFLGHAATHSERVLTATSSLMRSIGNMYLVHAMQVGPNERKGELEQARKHLKAAYECCLSDRPPWTHGIANVLASAAAYFTIKGQTNRRIEMLSHAEGHYRSTADEYRANLCASAQARAALENGTTEHLMELLFME